MTRDEIIGELDAMATDDLNLDGDWEIGTANERCMRYGTLVHELLKLEG